MLQSDIGDMFVVRNAGAVMPHASVCQGHSMPTEPVLLQLGCVANNIKDIFICGHSDCKAMNLLYNIRSTLQDQGGSPLLDYMKRIGEPTVKKFAELEKAGGTGPVTLDREIKGKTFDAYIDPEKNFCVEDQLSQLNTLVQIGNVGTHEFMQEKLNNGEAVVHAFWYDIWAGNYHYFSRKEKRFVVVDESNASRLQEEATQS